MWKGTSDEGTKRDRDEARERGEGGSERRRRERGREGAVGEGEEQRREQGRSEGGSEEWSKGGRETSREVPSRGQWPVCSSQCTKQPTTRPLPLRLCYYKGNIVNMHNLLTLYCDGS